MTALSVGRGVTQVMNRCENAKTTGLLDLSECMLMYIADAIYLVLKDYQIKRCNLRNNQIKKFPKKMIEKFPQISVLILDGNELAEIPNEICNWHQLKGINLAHNKFKEFPNSLLQLKQLALLDLSHNEIQDVNIETICNEMPSLKQMNLIGNSIEEYRQQQILSIAANAINKVIIKL